MIKGQDLTMAGLLPVMLYHFKQEMKTTTLLFDQGSTVSLIKKSLASDLFLEGFPLMTSLYRACDKYAPPAPCIHYDVLLKDRSGKTHKV